jgi:putative transposase
MVGLLNSVNSYLLGVTQEVTAKSEATGFTSNSKDKSTALAVEPSNPLQLSLFEWINGQVIGCSESLYL